MGIAGSWPAPLGFDERWAAVDVDDSEDAVGRRIVLVPYDELRADMRFCGGRLEASYHEGGKVHCDGEPGHRDLHHATVEDTEIWWRPTDSFVAQPVPPPMRRVVDAPQEPDR